MAQSIKEQIVDNIIASLEEITTAGGYNQTLMFVTRVAGEIDGSHSWPCALVEVVNDDPDDEVTAGYLHWTLSVNIYAWTIDNVNPQQALSYLAADIHTALFVGTGNTRGQLAIDTQIVDVDYEYAEPGEEPTGAVTVSIKVKYRTIVENPYTG